MTSDAPDTDTDTDTGPIVVVDTHTIPVKCENPLRIETVFTFVITEPIAVTAKAK